MDDTEWIAIVIVGLAAAYLVLSFICRKKGGDCCSGGCPIDPRHKKK